MDIKNLRYIVFMLNPDTQQYFGNQRIDTHDGNIFCSLKEAEEYAMQSVEDKQCTRFAIGTFVWDNQAERIAISCIETFGFRNDKKNINQLELFSASST